MVAQNADRRHGSKKVGDRSDKHSKITHNKILRYIMKKLPPFRTILTLFSLALISSACRLELRKSDEGKLNGVLYEESVDGGRVTAWCNELDLEMLHYISIEDGMHPFVITSGVGSKDTCRGYSRK